MDIEQLISQYLDGELSSEAEGEFHQKLSISPEARALFREHLKLQSIARDERVLHQPTASMQSALFARLQEEEGMAPVGALPLIEEEEAPSPAHSPIISPTKPRAVPTPSGDRTSVASVDDQRSEERRRKRRLIPILIPLMLLCIVGGVFLVDGNFFGGGKNGEEIAYNAQAQEESAERATAPLSDRDYSDPANPVTTTTPVPEKTSSTPENSGSGTIALNTGGNRKNDSPQLSSKKSTTKALTIEPDEASLAALSTEERSALEIEPAYKLSPSPKRVSPRSEQESDLYEKESEDAYSSFSYDPNTDSDDWNSKNEDPANDLAYDYDAQDSEVTTDFTNLTDSDNYETLDAIAPSMPLQDGLSLTMRPETRSKSNIAEDKDREATKSEETAPALILNMTESSTDKPVLATIDNQEATLDLLKQNGITIDPTTLTFSVDNPGFNIRGGRGNAPLVEQHSGFEILERT
ncbi:MAG: anti-sigma factor, partial [Candidatus Kapaibacterium sp.]